MLSSAKRNKHELVRRIRDKIELIFQKLLKFTNYKKTTPSEINGNNKCAEIWVTFIYKVTMRNCLLFLDAVKILTNIIRKQKKKELRNKK